MGGIQNIKNRKSNARMIATINLNRSYRGAEEDVFIAALLASCFQFGKFPGVLQDLVLFGEETFIESAKGLFHFLGCQLG